MNVNPLEALSGGERAELVTLSDGALRCVISTYGGTIVSLEVLNRDGAPTDIVLGFDTLADYERQTAYIGALIGRYANRIGGSRFPLGGGVFELFPNDGANHLHGGRTGFDKKIWTVHKAANGVCMSLTSPHMDEGYPGGLSARVTYTLTGGALAIRYEAQSDRDTLCNLTNHAYFNLAGHGSGDILSHVLRLNAAYYTPVADSGCIPTGEIAAVEGTPMDFRSPTSIGDRIDADFDQLRFGSGYDHNWIVNGEAGALREAAEVYCPDSGISMAVCTTMPGIQFYSGNHLDGCPAGKGGAIYKKRHGFCLETQFYPDSPNHPNFPQPLLRAGIKWLHTTTFTFSVR